MIKITINILFLYWIFVSNTSALEQKEVDNKYMRSKVEEYHLDAYTVAGKYLIYNCTQQHYACVDSNTFENCAEKRKDDFLRKNEKVSCAPIAKFDSKEECLLKNYDLQSRKILRKFCFNLN